MLYYYFKKFPTHSVTEFDMKVEPFLFLVDLKRISISSWQPFRTTGIYNKIYYAPLLDRQFGKSDGATLSLLSEENFNQ